jgi:hypothetical protein
MIGSGVFLLRCCAIRAVCDERLPGDSRMRRCDVW